MIVFPIEKEYYSGDMLGTLQLAWYNNIDPDKKIQVCSF